MLIKVSSNGDVENYSTDRLKKDNKNVSFPHKIPVETLAKYKVYLVTRAPQPECDRLTHCVTWQPPVEQGGVWTQNAVVERLTVDEALQNVRRERDKLIAKSDWTQLKDSPITNGKVAEWVQYRKDLRDITSAEDIYTITWPIKPD